MHIDKSTVTTSSGKTHTRVLLRESYRKDGKVMKRTIANLTSLPPHAILALQKSLRGENPAETLPAGQLTVRAGKKFGALFLLAHYLKKTGVWGILGHSQKGLLVMWLICARILFQGSRLLAARSASLYDTEAVFGFESCCEDSLYEALDWLAERQTDIEDQLNASSAKPELLLYDVTSHYFEGSQNELADFGYNRDGKKGKRQIVVGLLTDLEGDPLSIEVFPGNTIDTKTCSRRIETIKERFGADSITLVGDRGMIKGDQIKSITDTDGWDYITAITKPQIRGLLKSQTLKHSLFDEKVQEVIDGKTRYVLKLNPVRRREVRTGRNERMQKAEAYAAEQTQYLKTHPRAKEEAALKRVKKKISKLKLEKLLKAHAAERAITIDRQEDELAQEALLDGCYVIKSSITNTERMTAQEIHDRYKDLSKVEWAFRTIKTTLLENRPIYHRLATRTRGVCFVSMLAYKVARQITRDIEPHVGAFLELKIPKKSERKNQVITLVDILEELNLVQKAKVMIDGKEHPVTMEPTVLGKTILSKLNVKMNTKACTLKGNSKKL